MPSESGIEYDDRYVWDESAIRAFGLSRLSDTSFAIRAAEFGLTSLMTVSRYCFMPRFIAAVGGRGGASRASTSRRDSSALRRITGGLCRADLRAFTALGIKGSCATMGEAATVPYNVL